jgi:hypothetical protein
MSTIQVTVANSVRERIEHFAQEEGISVDEYLAAVISQRIAVAEADSYIRRRGARGSANRMLNTLRRVSDIEPEPWDRIPTDEDRAIDSNA